MLIRRKASAATYSAAPEPPHMEGCCQTPRRMQTESLRTSLQ